MFRHSLAFLLVAAMLTTLAACAESSTGPEAGPNEVRVGNNFFNPGTRTVGAGTEVTFTWNSGSSSHNVTFDDGPASPSQTSGTYARTFANPGNYPYHCTIHGSGMSGTISVN
jgi:plastocyanin